MALQTLARAFLSKTNHAVRKGQVIQTTTKTNHAVRKGASDHTEANTNQTLKRAPAGSKP